MKRIISIILTITLLLGFAVSEESTWTCSVCGKTGLTGNFCGRCGTTRPEEDNGWTCPNCGTEGNTTKFCGECGSKRPEEDAGWTCPNCGAEGITTKFCGECGFKRPEEDAGWTCPNCGAEGNTTKFCGECGSQKPLNNVKTGAWKGFVSGDNYELKDGLLKLNVDCEGTSFDTYLEEVMSLLVSTEVALGYQSYSVFIFGSTFEKNAGDNLADLCIGNPKVASFTSETSAEERKEILRGTLADLLVMGDLPICFLTVENSEYLMTVTIAKNCTVRSGAGMSFRSLGELFGGMTVKCKGIVNATDGTGAWYEIDYHGEKGYIAASVVMSDHTNSTSMPKATVTAAPTITPQISQAPTAPATTKPDITPAPTAVKTWSAWTEWSVNRQSPSGIEGVDWKVDTKTEENHTYKTVYHYSHYKYIGKNGNNWYGPIDMSNSSNYLRNGRWEYKNSDTKLSKTGTASAGGKSYAYYGDNYWFNETTTEEIASTTTVTYYRYSYFR